LAAKHFVGMIPRKSRPTAMVGAAGSARIAGHAFENRSSATPTCCSSTRRIVVRSTTVTVDSVPFYVIGRNGYFLPRPIRQAEVLLGPGQ
jgi:hypothetical protein